MRDRPMWRLWTITEDYGDEDRGHSAPDASWRDAARGVPDAPGLFSLPGGQGLRRTAHAHRADRARGAWHPRRHGAAARQVLRHNRRILDQPAEAVRS